ncbi:isoprenylcysteine carboxylmethyltransferase family protein [Aureimonas sp. SK2]|uniref:methyltransferase family protein n=1 Tax=Aureimonas sp. SK2 TaxID=3015992 RepID=UPI002444856F|nr:isoprenylcysteine carboxylmethyltransferase family protein [Aureimonas sp. SK2]
MNTIDINLVQQRRKRTLRLSGLALLALCVAIGPIWAAHSVLEEAVESAGLAAIAAGVIGRAWCSLYIGGRKTKEIVEVGPYSISRNPLYVFTYLAMFGVGAQSGSLTIGLVLALSVAGIFRVVISREEAFLAAEFGSAYDAYCLRVPRFGPRFSAWRDMPVIEVRPDRVARTLADGLLFLLAWPAFELLEEAREFGWIGTVLLVP